MQDEGEASWAFQRDGVQEPELQQIESELYFADKQAQVSYLTKKLRFQEGRPVPKHSQE